VTAKFIFPGHPDVISPQLMAAIRAAPHPQPARSDSRGRFEISAAKAGEYRVKAETSGFAQSSAPRSVSVGPSWGDLALAAYAGAQGD